MAKFGSDIFITYSSQISSWISIQENYLWSCHMCLCHKLSHTKETDEKPGNTLCSVQVVVLIIAKTQRAAVSVTGELSGFAPQKGERSYWGVRSFSPCSFPAAVLVWDTGSSVTSHVRGTFCHGLLRLAETFLPRTSLLLCLARILATGGALKYFVVNQRWVWRNLLFLFWEPAERRLPGKTRWGSSPQRARLTWMRVCELLGLFCCSVESSRWFWSGNRSPRTRPCSLDGVNTCTDRQPRGSSSRGSAAAAAPHCHR